MRKIKATPKKAIVAILLVIAAAILLALAILNAPNANAGIGPAGFAFYARQGINHGIRLAYGSLANSPYNVRCVDHPNYVTLSDRVVCTITEKP